MSRLITFVKAYWEELLIAGVFLQSLIAAVFTFNPKVVIATAIGGLALLIIVFEGVNKMQQYRRRPRRGENVAFQVPRRAVVFTVGGQSFTIEYALATQGPELVGFLCSQHTENVADEIIARYDLDEERHKKELVDPQSIIEIRAKIGFILDWLFQQGLAPEDIVIDITGGMTPMSVGAFSVAEERRIDSQYIKSDYDANNRPIPGTQEAIFVSRYSELPEDAKAGPKGPRVLHA